jgi:hypothetical protein
VVGPQQLPVADARLHGEYDLGDDLGGLWPHHVGAQDLLGVLVDHQLQRPLGSPRIAVRALNARSAVGIATRRPAAVACSAVRPTAASGGRVFYRPRQALAADLPHAGSRPSSSTLGKAGVGVDHRLDVDGPNRALREP